MVIDHAKIDEDLNSYLIVKYDTVDILCCSDIMRIFAYILILKIGIIKNVRYLSLEKCIIDFRAFVIYHIFILGFRF